MEEQIIIGDASEVALFRYCQTFVDVETYREKYPKIFEIPFNSKNKWQLSIHEDTKNQQVCVSNLPYNCRDS